MVSRIMPEENNKLPELITLSKAAEILKVHPNTLRAWDKKGILVAVRIGEKGIRKYKKEDIIKLINKSSQRKT
jgi:DNA-binding transcriptional MerR regulator